MTDKKKVNKKAIEYVRPGAGSFDLKAFPGVAFKFKKLSVDSEAWVKKTFGLSTWDIVKQGAIEADQLCRLYFHLLEDDSKAHFPPEVREVVDYENGGKRQELLNGPTKFMQAIDGGSLTELLIIGQAFLETLIASRPLADLPDDLKKSVLEALEKMKANAEPKPEAASPAEPRKADLSA